MSKMFNYDDIHSLIKESTKWEPLDDTKYYYAIKFIFGEIDAARRMNDRNKETGKYKQNKIDGRLKMLKSLAASICRLPIDSTNK